jgi:hypothetical protein
MALSAKTTSNPRRVCCECPRRHDVAPANAVTVNRGHEGDEEDQGCVWGVGPLPHHHSFCPGWLSSKGFTYLTDDFFDQPSYARD